MERTRLITPIRTLACSGYRLSDETLLTTEKYPIIEVFCRISANKLVSMRHDPEVRSREVGKWIRYVRKSKAKGEIVFFTLRVDGENIDKISAEFLADTISGLGADIVSIPVTLDHNPKTYIEFVETFHEEFKSTTYGTKIELAYPTPPNILKDYDATRRLLKTYLKKKPTILLVDYNGSNPFSSIYLSSTKYIHRWKTSKLEKTIKQPSIIYGINIKPKAKWYPLPARDLATIFLDFNILGSNHIPLKLPREIIEELRKRYKPKLLNIETYGYLRLDEAKDQLPERYKPKITLNKVQQDKELYKLFNTERQLIETKHIAELIEKEENLKEYIKNKKHLDRETKRNILEITWYSR